MSCDNCVFGDKCHGRKVCKHFSPLDDYTFDYETLKSLSEGKKDFYEEWNEYISEYGDD